MSDSTSVAEQMLQHIFNIRPFSWREACFDTKLIECHFFTEIYEIGLSDTELAKHPEAQRYLEIFPDEFVRIKVKEATYNYQYALRRLEFHELLRQQPEEDQLFIRRRAIYEMHEALMRKDFNGDIYGLETECQDLTKEAEAFIAANSTATGKA